MQNKKSKALRLIFLAGLILAINLATVKIGLAVTKETSKGKVMPATIEAKVDYDLPFPGILADHPLYQIKMLRDRIWGFLVRDPLKKSKWSLLMADKRILAAQQLAQKGKYELALTTAGKAEKYLEQAVELAYQAVEMGKGERDFFNRLVKSSLKHEEVLQEITSQVPQEWQKDFVALFEYPKTANQKALMLLTKE